MMQHCRTGTIAVLLGLLLAGCVSTPAGVTVEDATSRALAVAASWSMTGKLGVQAAAGSGNLGIRWQQQDDNYAIDLYGPMGVNVGQIGGDANSAWLEAGGDRQWADSAESLAELALGYPLPVSPMRYWVRGIPAPGEAPVSNADGFSQLGWRVRIISRGESGPARIQLLREDIRLLLVVREWRF